MDSMDGLGLSTHGRGGISGKSRFVKLLANLAGSLLFLFWIIAPSASTIPDSQKSRDSELEGRWRVVSLEAQGHEAPAEVVAALKVVFKNGTVTFEPGEPGFTTYTYRVDRRVDPPQMDLTPTEGEKRGMVQKGIYRLEGDQLTVCLGMQERPKEIGAKLGSLDAIYVLRRMKPQA